MWTDHLELEHGFGPSWDAIECPLCLESTKSGKSAVSIHFARHLEDIAIVSLSRDVESDAGSESEEQSIIDTDLISQGSKSTRSAYDDKRKDVPPKNTVLRENTRSTRLHLRQDAWEPMQSTIRQLYLTENRTLEGVQTFMAENFAFVAS